MSTQTDFEGTNTQVAGQLLIVSETSVETLADVIDAEKLRLLADTALPEVTLFDPEAQELAVSYTTVDWQRAPIVHSHALYNPELIRAMIRSELSSMHSNGTEQKQATRYVNHEDGLAIELRDGEKLVLARQ